MLCALNLDAAFSAPESKGMKPISCRDDRYCLRLVEMSKRVRWEM